MWIAKTQEASPRRISALLFVACLLAAATTAVVARAATGACCEADGSCNEGTSAACDASSGVYQGDGSTCATHCPQPTGTQFTLQGAIAAGNGVPLGGTIDVEASLWDAATDGAKVAGPVEQDAVELDQGLFTVQLDFGGDVFNGDARWLQIAVRHPAGSGGDFQPISPRQPIRAVPYAIQTRGIFVDDHFRVGVGTITPQYRLDVRSPAPRAIFGWATNPTGDTHGVYGQSASSQGKGVTGYASANSGETIGVYGLSTSPTGRGVYGLATSSSGVNYGVYAKTNSDDGFAGYFAGRGKFTEDLGVGTTPNALLHVSRATTDTRPTLLVDTQQDLGGNILDIVSLAFAGNSIDASSLAAGPLPLRLNPNTQGDVLLGFGNGRVGIGENSPMVPLHVQAKDISLQADAVAPHADVVIEDTDAVLGLYSNSGPDWASAIVLGQVDGNGELVDKWSIAKRTGGELRFLYGTDTQPGHTAGAAALRLTPDGVTKVKVLEILGADVAERFPSSEAATPGTVMEIDPEHPGHLRIARGAYNRRVAGVVSGAGDLPVGAVLGNLARSENGPPIALSGRVWVRCDATESPIQPGDLLTTASEAGHAMKIMDRARAAGATIGKAMSSLPKGCTGLVLVLVSLQ